jgi:recombination protein RecT
MAKNKNSAKELVEFLESKSLEVAKVTPANRSVEEMVKMAVIAVTDSPKVLECSPISIYRSFMQTCQMGLSLSPILNEAHLIPYGGTCTLQVGYRGWLKLCKESGLVEDIYAAVVHENDDFAVSMGFEPSLTHDWAIGARGVPTHVYAVVRFFSGYKRFEVVPWSDIEKAKQLSKRGGKINNAWAMWQEEMSKKVAIKRLAKTLPLGENLARAAAIENNANDGVFLDPEIDDLEDFIEATTVVDGEIGEVPEIPKSLKERLAHVQDG